MTTTRPARETGSSRHRMVGIYLNDHLAGATAGAELAHRVTRSHRDREEGGDLRRLAAEIGQDRAALLEIMATLGVAARGYKVGAAWIGEKAGRLKLNGRLLTRSPVSDLEELEMLRLGVEGKAAGWRTLRAMADAARGSTPVASMSLSPGPGARLTSSRNCGSVPRAASSAVNVRPEGWTARMTAGSLARLSCKVWPRPPAATSWRWSRPGVEGHARGQRFQRRFSARG